jgi:hypothetical protein
MSKACIQHIIWKNYGLKGITVIEDEDKFIAVFYTK